MSREGTIPSLDTCLRIASTCRLQIQFETDRMTSVEIEFTYLYRHSLRLNATVCDGLQQLPKAGMLASRKDLLLRGVRSYC